MTEVLTDAHVSLCPPAESQGQSFSKQRQGVRVKRAVLVPDRVVEPARACGSQQAKGGIFPVALLRPGFKVQGLGSRNGCWGSIWAMAKRFTGKGPNHYLSLNP